MRLLLLAVVTSSLSSLADDKVDLGAVHRIKTEAFEHSQVMDTLFWLTEANGPRLTGSPGYQRAADWSVKKLKDWGASNAHTEKWGSFGRGWTAGRSSVVLTSPVLAMLDGTPRAWTLGTQGPVSGEVVWAPLVTKDDPGDYRDIKKYAARVAAYAERYKGTLKGKIVLVSDIRELRLPTEAAGTRYDDAKLSAETQSPAPVMTPTWEEALQHFPPDDAVAVALESRTPLELQAARWEQWRQERLKLTEFFRTEGVLAVFSTDGRGEGGISFAEAGGDYTTKTPAPTSMAMTPESYNRLVRLLQHKLPVKVELNVEATFGDEVADGFNVVGELPGGKKKDEVVMLGGHLDSWHAGTGATDDGAGSAVALEAFRILKALNLPMDRTVRVALWSGEEQGLFGSRGYVKEHFGDPMTMKLKPEHAKLAGYFNLDNGAGKIRGVYLQGNDAVRPIFEQWLAPFRDLGATALALRPTFGTDHQSFDGVGLPGFQFIQDPLDYGSRTHHSKLDTYDHALPSDLMQAAAVMAFFVYEAANRSEPLPRKPLPAAVGK